MKIKFCGAARNVTGSSHLITLDSGYKILLDCGLYQGGGKSDIKSNSEFHFDPREVDCLILSHGHIDHTGRVPQLVKKGFKGCIHSTHATRSLCAIMLLDSAKIQEREAEFWNKRQAKKKKKRRKPRRDPIYTSKDVLPAMELFRSYPYAEWIHINDKVEIRFNDAGHLLGSASVNLRIKEGRRVIKLGFTGDIGRPDRPILRDPQLMEESDYLICESTYGDKEHESTPEQTDRFLQIVKETCVDNKGRLLIPAFSVGRTQEIVYMMDKLATAGKLPKIKVYVDSPLSVNATQVYGAHPECFDDALNEYMLIDDNPFGFNDLTYVRSVAGSKALNETNEPCVIISSSGMMNAGRIRHHLFNNLEDPKTTIMIVGYCSPDSAGGILRAGAETLKLFGEWKNVNAKIEIMHSFSAHADRKEIVQFLNPIKKGLKSIYLVHGEYDTQKKFRKYLGKNGFKNVNIPELGQEIELS
jgi:metallo-beta-lactamase family protein